MYTTTNSKQTIIDSIKTNGIYLSDEEKRTLFDKLGNYSRYNLRVTKDKDKVSEEAMNINDIHIDSHNRIVSKYIRRTYILKKYNHNFVKGFMNSYLNETSSETTFNLNSSEYPENEKQVFIIEDSAMYNNTHNKTLEVIVYILSTSSNFKMSLSN